MVFVTDTSQQRHFMYPTDIIDIMMMTECDIILE